MGCQPPSLLRSSGVPARGARAERGLARRPAGARLGRVRRHRARAARARRGADPARPAAHRPRARADPGRPLPRPAGHRRGRPGGAARVARPDAGRGAAAGPADARHQRHHRHAQGRVERPAQRRARRRAGRRGARPVGVHRRRRQPRGQPALPLGAAALRARHAARRRTAEHPRPVRPRGDHRRDRARPADVDVLRADPPPAALRPLGRHRLAGPVVLPAGRPRRRSLPHRPEAPADRGLPTRVDLGVLRLHRGPVHRLPQRGVAGAPGHRRPRPPRPRALRRRRRHPVVRGARARPLRVLRRPRPRPPPPGATPPAAPPSPSATPAGSTTTATSTSTVAATT